MIKLNIQNETGLCRYIPNGEGHIHHFTYLKMKSARILMLEAESKRGVYVESK